MADKASIVKEAQRYLARGQIDKAIAEWEILTKEFPDGSVFNTLGDLCLKKGDKSRAVESYHQAAAFFKREGFALKALALYKKILNIDPDDDGSLLALAELNEAKGLISDAMAFYHAAAASLSRAGKRETLAELYEKMIVLSPSDVSLRVKLAELYAADGRVSDAIKHYLRSAQMSAESGETDRAIGLYRTILGLEHRNRQALIELVDTFEMAGKNDAALSQVQEAINLYPQDPEILLRAAELYERLGMISEAKEYLVRVIDVEPANAKARKMRGDLYAREGERHKAWQEYLPVLDEILLDENEMDALRLLDSFSDIDPIETGKRLVTLFRRSGETIKLTQQLQFLGDTLVREGKKHEALNYYREALRGMPDNEVLKQTVIALERELGTEHIPVEEEKSSEEMMTEADIYLRYGLTDKARDILESLRRKDPDNIALRRKLKEIYATSAQTEEAITECLALRDLYERQGDYERSAEIIGEALSINPEDPRLDAWKKASQGGTSSSDALPVERAKEIEEAALFARQGMIDEAREILNNLNAQFPGNADIQQRLSDLDRTEDATGRETVTHVGTDEACEPDDMHIERTAIEHEDAAQLQNGHVMEIFSEFKKGLEKEIAAEDYETHYNLGIAYKEMALIDDAIREFQAARNDPKRFVDASNMLGMCYLEKGLYGQAIDVFRDSLAAMQERGEAYWSIQYELAEACERNNDLRGALETYEKIAAWNPDFRETPNKIQRLKESLSTGPEHQKKRERKDRVSYL